MATGEAQHGAIQHGTGTIRYPQQATAANSSQQQATAATKVTRRKVVANTLLHVSVEKRQYQNSVIFISSHLQLNNI